MFYDSRGFSCEFIVTSFGHALMIEWGLCMNSPVCVDVYCIRNALWLETRTFSTHSIVHESLMVMAKSKSFWKINFHLHTKLNFIVFSRCATKAQKKCGRRKVYDDVVDNVFLLRKLRLRCFAHTNCYWSSKHGIKAYSEKITKRRPTTTMGREMWNFTKAST